MGRGIWINPTLKERAKKLRKQSTDTEKLLWYYLRAKWLGYKFKHQVPIGKYIVDFVCLEKRIIVELDGGQHLINQQYFALYKKSHFGVR